MSLSSSAGFVPPNTPTGYVQTPRQLASLSRGGSRTSSESLPRYLITEFSSTIFGWIIVYTVSSLLLKNEVRGRGP